MLLLSPLQYPCSAIYHPSTILLHASRIIALLSTFHELLPKYPVHPIPLRHADLVKCATKGRALSVILIFVHPSSSTVPLRHADLVKCATRDALLSVISLVHPSSSTVPLRHADLVKCATRDALYQLFHCSSTVPPLFLSATRI